MPMPQKELLILTGMSGAGRSTVAHALEDLGWYVVDNLPPQMLGPIADLFSLAKTPLPRLAVVIDVRGGEFFGELTEHLASLRSRNINLRLLFLEATDSTLVKRFESVRRPHPLQGNGTILDGIAEDVRRIPMPTRHLGSSLQSTLRVGNHARVVQGQACVRWLDGFRL